MAIKVIGPVAVVRIGDEFRNQIVETGHAARMSDIEAMADFIRVFTTRQGRWKSPKFLIGESYGTTRASGLVDFLQDRHQSVLPWPDRQGPPAQGLHVRIQHQGAQGPDGRDVGHAAALPGLGYFTVSRGPRTPGMPPWTSSRMVRPPRLRGTT